MTASETNLQEIKALARVIDRVDYYRLLKLEQSRDRRPRCAARTTTRASRFHPDAYPRLRPTTCATRSTVIARRITEGYLALARPHPPAPPTTPRSRPASVRYIPGARSSRQADRGRPRRAGTTSPTASATSVCSTRKRSAPGITRRPHAHLRDGARRSSPRNAALQAPSSTSLEAAAQGAAQEERARPTYRLTRPLPVPARQSTPISCRRGAPCPQAAAAAEEAAPARSRFGIHSRHGRARTPQGCRRQRVQSSAVPSARVRRVRERARSAQTPRSR